ncbi:hypothetical protein ACFCWY_32740 [Streptomyces sp. NPDC056362]|uniref:hypothetical protein n=1 Tax=unclassified Streptomyces TaxID=2593676 RepID=UPI0035E28710
MDPALAQRGTPFPLLGKDPQRDTRCLPPGQLQQTRRQHRTDQVGGLDREGAPQGRGIDPAAHGVGVSALGRGTARESRAGLVTASLAIDDLIAGSGVAYRALACPSFYENLLEDAESIRERGVFTDTADADRRALMVAAADIAAAAAGLLLERSWSGVGSVPVLGPRDLSPPDLARVMTDELGRPVRYERQSLDDLRATMLGHGLAEAFVEGMVDMQRAKDEGLDEGADRASRAVVPGTDFARWCARTLKPAVLAAPEATGGR